VVGFLASRRIDDLKACKLTSTVAVAFHLLCMSFGLFSISYFWWAISDTVPLRQASLYF
jgi:hypothetical protein